MCLQYILAFIFSLIFQHILQKYIDRRTCRPSVGILTPVMLIHFMDFSIALVHGNNVGICGYYLLERIVSEMAGFLSLQLLRAQALTTLALG